MCQENVLSILPRFTTAQRQQRNARNAKATPLTRSSHIEEERHGPRSHGHPLEVVVECRLGWPVLRRHLVEIHVLPQHLQPAEHSIPVGQQAPYGPPLGVFLLGVLAVVVPRLLEEVPPISTLLRVEGVELLAREPGALPEAVASPHGRNPAERAVNATRVGVNELAPLF